MKINLAKEQDLPAITRIYNQSIATGTINAEQKQLTVKDRQAWFEAHQNNNYAIWTLEEDSEIIGYASLSFYGFNDYYTSAVEVSYYLDNSVQGHGLGKQILEFLIQQAKNRDFTYLIGRALTNNIASNKLMLKYGFIKWGQSPDLIQMPKITTSISYYAKYLK